MKFRPCIDIHDGIVKQIVGATLKDASTGTNQPVTNFKSSKPSSHFAQLYKTDGLFGGHVIMLGRSQANKEASIEALRAFPGGMHVGGGITPENAKEYLAAGASHVIVTSYVFRNGCIDFERLRKMVRIVGKKRLVLDLSCRRTRDAGAKGAAMGRSSSDVTGLAQSHCGLQIDNDSVAFTLGCVSKATTNRYFVVTDRWQKFTNFEITAANLRLLAEFCDEFLVHGVDVEGTRTGIDEQLVRMLGAWSPIRVTYAGGAKCLGDFDRVERLGRGRVDLTVGSALDIFGGNVAYADVVKWQLNQE